MASTLFDLTGKVALVTGSSQGLGYAMARGLAEAGATVVLNGRSAGKLQRAVASLRDDGLAAHGAAFDVTNTQRVAQGVEDVETRVGPVGVLVNNAGIQRRAPLEQMPEADWQAVLETNLTAVFRVTQRVVQGMIARRAGKIINIASLMSEVARPTIAPYTASKGGLKLLTQSMAAEWGQYNIQANAIGPGYFATEMNRALIDDDEFNAWVCARTPAGRWGDPSELVGTAVFLASRASDYVSGQVIYVDGGMLSRL
jgi:gluconate 5-dehydrogenase